MKWSVKWPSGNVLFRHAFFLWSYMVLCGALQWPLNIRWRWCTPMCHWLRDITLSSNDANLQCIFDLNNLVNSNLIWIFDLNFSHTHLYYGIFGWTILVHSDFFSTLLLTNDLSLNHIKIVLHLHACKFCVIPCLSWKTRLASSRLRIWMGHWSMGMKGAGRGSIGHWWKGYSLEYQHYSSVWCRSFGQFVVSIKTKQFEFFTSKVIVDHHFGKREEALYFGWGPKIT